MFAPAGWIALGAMVLMGFTSQPVAAQKTQDIAGTWQGTLPEGRVVLSISRAGGAMESHGWKGVFYSIDRTVGAQGRTVTSMSLQGTIIRFSVATIDGSFEGKLSGNSTVIAGTWTQNRATSPLTLLLANDETAWAIPAAERDMPPDASPEFEVATIKPAPSDWDRYGYHFNGHQVSCDNETENTMIRYAYGVSGSQIVGGPEWVSNDPYNVDGVPDILGAPSVKQMLGMYQKLLADRFRLTFHREKRELAAYAITVTKGGPKLAKSLGDPNGLPDETGDSDRRGITMRYTNVSLKDLAGNLQAMVGDGKPVVDQTGLAGRFDFTLKWTREQTPSTDPNAAPGLFTAIQEQLGLKLEPVKAPVGVIVIDHVERPSAN
jgi:uncharacterized protein (TIGR03435 family)